MLGSFRLLDIDIMLDVSEDNCTKVLLAVVAKEDLMRFMSLTGVPHIITGQ